MNDSSNTPVAVAEEDCKCACHEPGSIYPKEKSGHCWVCKDGMTIIYNQPNKETTQ